MTGVNFQSLAGLMAMRQEDVLDPPIVSLLTGVNDAPSGALIAIARAERAAAVVLTIVYCRRKEEIESKGRYVSGQKHHLILVVRVPAVDARQLSSLPIL